MKGKATRVTFLSEILQSEIQRRERSHVFKEPIASPSSLVIEEKRSVMVATASALQASSMAKTCKTVQCFSCGICSKPHSTDHCFKLLHVPVGIREEKLRAVGLCFRRPYCQGMQTYSIGTSGTSISTLRLSRFCSCCGLHLMIVSPSGVLSWPRICV